MPNDSQNRVNRTTSALYRDQDLRGLLAAVVESSDDAIITKNLDGIIQSWNEGARRIFAYTADEVVGKSITILIPPERIQEETNILATLRRGERVDHFETVRLRKDGTPVDLSLTISPVRNDAGEIIGASKIARDITNRKRIESALKASEAQLRAIVEATPECVKIVSPEGSLTFMNQAGICMIEADGMPAVEGGRVLDLVAPEYRESWQEYHQRVCAGEKLVWQFEIIGIKGTRRWMETHAVPLPLPDGRTAQLAVTRDISASKHSETEREKLLHAERAARAEAERVSMMKDEFLATLSHELRTPLNAILGWSQILSRTPADNADVTEGLKVIERNTRVQAQMIEDLLDMSRIISGKLRLDVQKVDLQDVIQASVASVRIAADAKNIRLQVVLDPLAGPVRGDPGRLQQCFWNLLSNAIKFTPKGGKIQVTLERVNSHVEICVIDNGQGIKPEFLPHLFERFRQADGSTTRKHTGLGLGLSIVRHLVELHGGKVRAKSPGEGQGATFCVDLPLMVAHPAMSEPDRAHPRSVTLNPPEMDHPKLDGITVLAVDDEPDARDVLKRILESCGAKVHLASSASQAMELLRQHKPDMIISDIGMPQEDGYEFIRKVRALGPDEGGSIPAAALTAFARTEDRTRALRAGYQSHIAKPVEPTELTAVVASLANRSSPASK